MLDLGEEQPERAEEPRERRDHDPVHAKLAGHVQRLHRPHPAEGEEREPARVPPALRRNGAERPDEGRVGDGPDPPRRLRRVDSEGLGDALADRALREVGADLERSARERLAVGEAEVHVRIRDRRLGSARVVARRPRHRPRALRPDLERARRIDPGDAAAPRPDLGEVDGRDPKEIPAPLHQAMSDADLAPDLVLGGARNLPFLDEGRLGGGPAHVEGHRIPDPHAPRQVMHPRHPRRGTGLDDVDGKLAGGVDRHHAAARLHDHDRRGDPDRPQVILHRARVAGDHGLDVGVDHGRAGALVLLDLGEHLGRDGYVCVRLHLRDEVAGTPLVGAVHVGVEVADRDRIDVLVEEAPHRFANLGFVKGRVLPGLRVDPRGHLPAQVPGHQGGGLLPVDVVEPVHPHTADLENVAEALGGDEPGGGAGAGDDGVGGHRRPVGEGPDRRSGHRVLAERIGHALPNRGIEVRRRGEDLLRNRPALRGHQHDVGKGASDVHRESKRVTHLLLPVAGRSFRRSHRLALSPCFRVRGYAEYTCTARDGIGPGRRAAVRTLDPARGPSRELVAVDPDRILQGSPRFTSKAATIDKDARPSLASSRGRPSAGRSTGRNAGERT